MIPFNKPYLTGKENDYIHTALLSGNLAGDGPFTKRCHDYFEKRYGFKKCLLTTSCTDALEMAALLINIQAGDEVIMPSYTFVSTANAFVIHGAKIVFCDSHNDRPGINESLIEQLITSRTKAIVPVHYAGVACDMDKIMELASKYNLYVIEDAAPAIDSYYTGRDGIKRPLGSIGHLASFSFHETKNIISGEGGMIVINDEQFIERAEIIWEKGTNRRKFLRGELDNYSWVDVGSSFLPSDIIAAFLYAQLENLDDIQQRRKQLWNTYYEALRPFEENGFFSLPVIPEFATNNAHIFYIVCKDLELRNGIINLLKSKNVRSVFHYLSLHKSPYYASEYDGRELPQADRFSDTLLRLPLFYELDPTDVIRAFDKLK